MSSVEVYLIKSRGSVERAIMNSRSKQKMNQRTLPMPLNLSSLSNDNIALLCRDPNAIISGDPNVRCLAKISDDVIVKCGWSVTAEEAANQEFIYTSFLVPAS